MDKSERLKLQVLLEKAQKIGDARIEGSLVIVTINGEDYQISGENQLPMLSKIAGVQ